MDQNERMKRIMSEVEEERIIRKYHSTRIKRYLILLVILLVVYLVLSCYLALPSTQINYIVKETGMSKEAARQTYLAGKSVGIMDFSNCRKVSDWEQGKLMTVSARYFYFTEDWVLLKIYDFGTFTDIYPLPSASPT